MTTADPNSRAALGRIPWGRLGFLGLVAVLAIACTSSKSEPADAGAVDTTPSPEQAACESAKESCRSFVWQGGQCVPKALVGAVCGEVAGACTVGVCDEAGQCTGKQPAAVGKECSVMAPTACQKQLGRCDANGGCVAEVFEGAKCTVGEGPCAGAGTCDSAGLCVAQAMEGAACKIHDGPCGSGVCDAAGACKQTALGQPCDAGTGPCAPGICSANATCVSQPLPAGSKCSASDPCLQENGICSAAGECLRTLLPEGSDCSISSPPMCKASAGKCSATGACLPATAAGASCPLSGPKAPCTVGICNSSGDCVAKPAPAGSACTYSSYKECHAGTGTCSSSGECVPTPLSGTKCEIYKGTCGAGTCVDGKCVSSVAGKPCNSGTGPCRPGKCSIGGVCTAEAPLPTGTPCTDPMVGQCFAKDGICSASGECVHAAKAGEKCVQLSGTCSEGTCSTEGKCISDSLGKKCSGSIGCIAGFCAANGNCEQKQLPIGATCNIPGWPKDCKLATGKCDSAGICVADFDVGAACFVGGNSCAPGLCDATGVCVQTNAAPAGAACGIDEGCGIPTCDAAGNCSVNVDKVGKACASSVKVSCAKKACSSAGKCVFVADPGASCFALNDETQSSCSVHNECYSGVCGEAVGECVPKPVSGKSCTATSVCTSGVCNSNGLCEQVPLADGVTCVLAGDVDPQCASAVCVAGKCAVAGNVGKSCGNNPCTIGICLTNGVCDSTPTPGKTCGQDTPCASQICDASGACKAVPKTGKSCPAAGPCFTAQCSASGQCVQTANVGAACETAGLCSNGVCNAQGACVDPAFPNPPACLAEQSSILSECWTGVPDSAGKCQKVAKVGASCGCSVSPCSIGTCQTDGSCLMKPSKPAGTPCSSKCVKNGICTSSGHCSGPVAPDALCDPDDLGAVDAHKYCMKHQCQPTGDCVAVPQPAGTSCSKANETAYKAGQNSCGVYSVCDGQGRCTTTSKVQEGKNCDYNQPCSQSRVCQGGYCISIGPKPDGTACKDGCASGICVGGVCSGHQPDEASCDDGNSCTEDGCCGATGKWALSLTCPYQSIGSCSNPVILYKECTVNYGECLKGVCELGWSGVCVGKKQAAGTVCAVDKCGGEFVCNSYGQCWFGAYSSPAAGKNPCDDGNPCTADSCQDCGCSHMPFVDQEGFGKISCPQGGHCLKGNCVPD